MTMTVMNCLNLVVLELVCLSFSKVEAFTAGGGASRNRHRGNDVVTLSSLNSADARWWSNALATTTTTTTTTLRMSDFDFPSAMPIKPELTMKEKLEESVRLFVGVVVIGVYHIDLCFT